MQTTLSVGNLSWKLFFKVDALEKSCLKNCRKLLGKYAGWSLVLVKLRAESKVFSKVTFYEFRTQTKPRMLY